MIRSTSLCPAMISTWFFVLCCWLFPPFWAFLVVSFSLFPFVLMSAGSTLAALVVFVCVPFLFLVLVLLLFVFFDFSFFSIISNFCLEIISGSIVELDVIGDFCTVGCVDVPFTSLDDAESLVVLGGAGCWFLFPAWCG